MTAPFDWWFAIVGLAAGAGLTWLVVGDLRRREEDLADRERADEAAWISATLGAEGRPASVHTVEAVLALHRWYLREPPRAEPASEAARDEDAVGEAAIAEDEVPGSE